MAQLIVRNLDDDLIQRLRKRAADKGNSMEAEHREILRQALTGSPKKLSLKRWLSEMPNGGEDRDFARDRGRPRKIRL